MSIADEPDTTNDLIDSGLVRNSVEWLQSQIEMGKLRGTVIVTIEDDAIGFRWFGHVPRYCMAMAGALLTDDAVRGEFTRPVDGAEPDKPQDEPS